MSQNPSGFDYPVKDLEVIPMPFHLLRTHQKLANNHDGNGGATPLKQGSDMHLRKKKTVMEYRIKTVSKSPQKPALSNFQQP
jgi:hypothetical protein